MNQPDLDPRHLAALVDGTLSRKERDALLARLGDSPEDLALLADVAAVQRESGVVSIEARRWPASVRPRTWLAIAAVAAGIALAPWYLMRDSAAVAGLPAGWNRDPWGGVRGGGGSATYDALPDQERAVRAGVRLTQLDVAIGAADTSAAGLALDVARLLAPVPGSAPTVQILEQAARSAAASDFRRARADLNDARDGVYAMLDSTRVALGAWTERARLAAHGRDARFFRSGETRAAIERAGTVSDTDGQPSSVAAAGVGAAIDRALTTRSDESWTALSDALVALVAALSL